ncbi:DUF4442 domain-containing protein [uncultured Cyclobacterium sp.]|uniref:DUF4442 domain-containing protein n=1 Tax=uncultured Cyclobacterium sp. TaxID=453820 RepID=UPI0030EEEF00
MNKNQQYFIRSMSQFSSYFWYMFKNLPSIVFWGVRLKTINLNTCSTTIPFNWRTKNPFKSIYFATLCGGAELASGMLCMLHLSGNEGFSMLVVDINGQFFKKANDQITMTCEDGQRIKETLEGLPNSGDTAMVKTTITGYNPAEEMVARFDITWSFKRK